MPSKAKNLPWDLGPTPRWSLGQQIWALRRLVISLAALGFILSLSPSAFAEENTFLTKDEALKLAFEDCEIKRTVVPLTDAMSKRVEKLSGYPPATRTTYAYRAFKKGTLVGTAYFDVNRVRTMRQVLMVVVGPECKIKRVELLAFAEPREYIPNLRWYGQFLGKTLNDALSLKHDIKGVTGATLTARATLQSVRRMLATHLVLTTPPARKNPTETKLKAKPGGTA